MTYTDEQLSAYIDGELSDTEARTLEAELMANPAVKDRLQMLSQANQFFKSGVSALDDELMPESVLSLLETETQALDNVITLKKPNRVNRRWWTGQIAAAAALMVGIGIGGALHDNTSPQATVLMAGPIARNTPIDMALTQQISGASISIDDDISLKPILTFEDERGVHCREFELQTQEATNRALACREQSGWSVLLIASTQPENADGGYSTASSDVMPTFDAFVDSMIKSSPLSADQERGVIASKWRN